MLIWEMVNDNIIRPAILIHDFLYQNCKCFAALFRLLGLDFTFSARVPVWFLACRQFLLENFSCPPRLVFSPQALALHWWSLPWLWCLPLAAGFPGLPIWLDAMSAFSPRFSSLRSASLAFAWFGSLVPLLSFPSPDSFGPLYWLSPPLCLRSLISGCSTIGCLHLYYPWVLCTGCLSHLGTWCASSKHTCHIQCPFPLSGLFSCSLYTFLPLLTYRWCFPSVVSWMYSWT